ncbi:molybdenum-dependent transcriptional regulator [Caulobacter sp. UC70_42]|uniref:molybdenum-dependent transcriptional regulator n=1 Tax=Caulobacter sp. UC70_42 TaxID=3374551 RepID=UPI0037573399
MAREDDFSASLILKRGGLTRVGLERIALLEAVAGLGSISAAAKHVGLSYKGAWDGIQALNNLFDAPLVSAAPGGRSGGTTEVTPRGQAVIRAFRAAEREVGAAFARLEADLSGDAEPLWSLGLRTSARNALRGVVTAIEGDGVTAVVTLALTDSLSLRASITQRSVRGPEPRARPGGHRPDQVQLRTDRRRSPRGATATTACPARSSTARPATRRPR